MDSLVCYTFITYRWNFPCVQIEGISLIPGYRHTVDLDDTSCLEGSLLLSIPSIRCVRVEFLTHTDSWIYKTPYVQFHDRECKTCEHAIWFGHIFSLDLCIIHSAIFYLALIIPVYCALLTDQVNGNYNGFSSTFCYRPYRRRPPLRIFSSPYLVSTTFLPM